MSIAVVTDSNSGISQEEASALGITVIPMPFMMDGKTYFEGIDLTQEEFYARLRDGADITTSQPAPGAVMDVWNQLLETHEEVVHIPMSSGLSSSYATANMLEEEYDGRVEVVNNHRISVTQRQSVLDALQMAQEGYDAAAVKETLERNKGNSTIYITVDTLEYLKKGGRITPAAALLGTFLKIKPVLTIQGEKLDAYAKARTMKQAKSLMVNAVQKDMDARFHDPGCEKSYLAVAHTYNDEAAREFSQELQRLYPHTSVYVAPLALSIACHIGPGALAAACTRIADVFEGRQEE